MLVPEKPARFIGGVFDLDRPFSGRSDMVCGISLLNISDRRTDEYVRLASSTAGGLDRLIHCRRLAALTLLYVQLTRRLLSVRARRCGRRPILVQKVVTRVEILARSSRDESTLSYQSLAIIIGCQLCPSRHLRHLSLIHI